MNPDSTNALLCTQMYIYNGETDFEQLTHAIMSQPWTKYAR